VALFGALVPGLDRHSSGCLHSSCAHRHPHSRAVRYPDHRAGPAGNNRTGGCSPSYTHPTVPTLPHTGSAGNRSANPRSYAHPGSCSNRGTHTKSYLHPGYGGNAYACSRTNSNAYSRSGANTIPDSSAADSIPDSNALALPGRRSQRPRQHQRGRPRPLRSPTPSRQYGVPYPGLPATSLKTNDPPYPG